MGIDDVRFLPRNPETKDFYVFTPKTQNRLNPYDILPKVSGVYSIIVSNPTQYNVYVTDNQNRILSRVLARQSVVFHSNVSALRFYGSQMETMKYVNRIQNVGVNAQNPNIFPTSNNDDQCFITFTENILPPYRSEVPDLEFCFPTTWALPFTNGGLLLMGIPYTSPINGQLSFLSSLNSTPSLWLRNWQYPIPQSVIRAHLQVQVEVASVTPSSITIAALYARNLELTKSLAGIVNPDSELISGNAFASMLGLQPFTNYVIGGTANDNAMAFYRWLIRNAAGFSGSTPYEVDLTPYQADFYTLFMPGGDSEMSANLIIRTKAEFWPYD